MTELLSKLFALYATLKNLHYSARGVEFYSIHKLADEMNDNIIGYADEIQENFYLGQGMEATDLGEIYLKASAQTTSGDVDTCLRGVLRLINEILELMPELKTEPVEDIFSRLSNELYKNKGFVLRTLL